MSSFVRNIQRAGGRQKYHKRRASALGITNPNAKDLAARVRRELARIKGKLNG